VEDERKRKLYVRSFFWLMVFSANEPSNQDSVLSVIGFFLGAIALLYPESEVTSLSKMAVSKRLTAITWYLFRDVYNHLLERCKAILGSKEMKFLGQFKEACLVDGSVIALSKKLQGIFASVPNGQASLKLNTKFSLTAQPPSRNCKSVMVSVMTASFPSLLKRRTVSTSSIWAIGPFA